MPRRTLPTARGSQNEDGLDSTGKAGWRSAVAHGPPGLVTQHLRTYNKPVI